jgi:hypothetical protein
MTLGNMRANGVPSLAVRCMLCHHQAVLSVDAWADGRAGALFRATHALRRQQHQPNRSRTA